MAVPFGSGHKAKRRVLKTTWSWCCFRRRRAFARRPCGSFSVSVPTCVFFVRGLYGPSETDFACQLSPVLFGSWFGYKDNRAVMAESLTLTSPSATGPIARSLSQPYVWMLGSSFSFALMAALTHHVGTTCDWRVGATARAGFAFLFAVFLCRCRGVRLVVFDPPLLWIRSIAGSLALVGGFYALAKLPTAEVLTLTNMYPLWVGVLCWPLYGQLPRLSVWIAIASAIVGVVLIERPDLELRGWAAVIALASSGFAAIALLGLHRLRGVDSGAIVVHFSGVSFAFCLASLMVFGPIESVAGLSHLGTWLVLVGVGLSATAGQLLLTRAFAAGPPAQVSVLGLTQVVFALGFDLLFWGKTYDVTTLVGIAFVLAPTGWIMIQRGR